MSVYAINKIIYMADNDPMFRQLLKDGPDAALAPFKLTEEEEQALTSGAVGKLRDLGVHTFLLNHLARYELFGVNRDNYLDRLREGLPYDPRWEQAHMPVQYFVHGSQGGQSR
jgi:hypothetical protein